MGMIKEFREFAFKGNMVDMAVGIIIGAAFGGLVKSIVDKIMMPPLGLLMGNMDFSDYSLTLKEKVVDEAGKETPAVVLQYGAFVTELINFAIVAFAVFLVVKAINTARRRFEEEKPEAPKGPTQEELLTDIRDLLKAKA
ncbi:MAG: large-conductance mechanosensitive channel protein MscL [Phycisphaerales bacterium]|nr:large-conductance mechanosensitive channel protein MscL [Phycisphaerales bacterium]MCB9856363.1 large-conductance mechanosensitive channel protein MscL [Phycisphaerales bacterium]MCB9864035.1 large-conductance mechanosensitive channel protein MscL [Phycisphaerales bacterium]